MKFDHLIINVDQSQDRLEQIKSEIEPLGFPYQIKGGKGTVGFEASSIWIGEEYLELSFMNDDDDNKDNWKQEWVAEYNQGQRGLAAIVLLTDDIERLYHDLQDQGLEVSKPSRVSFGFLLGILQKSMPWQNLSAGKIPGTDVRIIFQQNDEGVGEQLKQNMTPNAAENGITGISKTKLEFNFTAQTEEFLEKVLPQVECREGVLEYGVGRTKLLFENVERDDLQAQVRVTTKNEEYQDNQFQIRNLAVRVDNK